MDSRVRFTRPATHRADPSSLRRRCGQADPRTDLLKPRVAVKKPERGLDGGEDHVKVVLFARVFQRLDCLFALAQPRVYLRGKIAILPTVHKPLAHCSTKPSSDCLAVSFPSFRIAPIFWECRRA
jgi:hypothetical protein